MRKFKILISYHYFRNTDLDRLFGEIMGEPYPEVFADSGAFSALTQGAAVDIHEYAAWLTRWKHWFVTYANLDVIKDAEGTWTNQQILEDQYGLTPLPVFHVLEDWSWLEHYLDRYSYIALGVAAMQNRKDQIMRWLVRCFQLAQDRAVYHGFGLTGWRVLSALPWYSVDSTSWSKGVRFGRVPIFDRRVNVLKEFFLGNWSSIHPFASQIRELGFDPDEFADREKNARGRILTFAALAYLQLEEYLRERHGLITLPDRDPGAHIYMVGANSSNLRDAFVGCRLFLADTTYNLRDIRHVKDEL